MLNIKGDEMEISLLNYQISVDASIATRLEFYGYHSKCLQCKKECKVPDAPNITKFECKNFFKII